MVTGRTRRDGRAGARSCSSITGVAPIAALRIPARVGLVGCGVISREYAKNAVAFDSFDLVACSDINPDAASALADEFALTALSVGDVLSDPAIDIVLNLTPAAAHASINRAALEAGKHIYSEKPLATTVQEATGLLAEAAERRLLIGCAPDTFLSAAFQTGRRMLDEGAIGEPIAVSASMMLGGQTSWHPNPDIFYADGAGPLLDMGPYYLTALTTLLGPVRRIVAMASTRTAQQRIEVGPRAGETFLASTPSHTAATLELEGGVTASLIASFDAPGIYVSDFTIYGTAGVLTLPDPNSFDSALTLQRNRSAPEQIAVRSRGARDSRGLGLEDLVHALRESRSPRASGQLAHHAVEVARAILQAAHSGRTVEVTTAIERPPLLAA